MKADPGKVPKVFEQFLVESKKNMPFSKPPATDGQPRTGRTEADAIPLVWWKPFDRYQDSIRLPASVFGSARKPKRFPHKVYSSERRGTNLELGVNNWPYVGMTLRKKSNVRGGEVSEFKRQLEEHGVALNPNNQIDHVIDLMFERGTDSFDNLWPLPAAVNTAAGGRWSNGLSLVEWVNRKGDPPYRTAPSAVPVGRWFVISEIKSPV